MRLRRAGCTSRGPLNGNVRASDFRVAADNAKSPPDMRSQLLDELRQECEHTLEARADRYLRIRHHGIISNTSFATASAECIDLFRDGHFYGAISLSQSVGEALVRHMCKMSGWRPAKRYEENVRKLVERNVIDDRFAQKFLELWERRDDYHHLNAGVETGRDALERLALSKVQVLAEIERRVFAFSIKDGQIVLHYPKFWTASENDHISVYLRRPTV